MSVAEMEEARTVRELQTIFKNGYERKANSEKRISECNQGFLALKSNSQSAVSHVQTLQSAALRQQINEIKSTAQAPKVLDDLKLVELKQSLNTLFVQCDSLDSNLLKASNLEPLPKYLKNILLNDDQFISLTEADEQVVQSFKETAEPIKLAHRQRVILGEEIEKETLRIIKKRKIIRNTFILVLMCAGGFLFSLKENEPQLFNHYLNLVKGLFN